MNMPASTPASAPLTYEILTERTEALMRVLTVEEMAEPDTYTRAIKRGQIVGAYRLWDEATKDAQTEHDWLRLFRLSLSPNLQHIADPEADHRAPEGRTSPVTAALLAHA